MSKILGGSAGAYAAAKKIFAAHAGAWVEVPLGGGGETPPTVEGEWTRPSDWLPSTVASGEQKAQLLVGVPSSTTSLVKCVVAVTPQWTVDWGDGSPVESDTVTMRTHYFNPATMQGPTSDGWLQSMVTITPNTGSLTAVRIGGQSSLTNYSSPVIEMVIGPSTVTQIETFLAYNGRQSADSLVRVEFKQPLELTTTLKQFYDITTLRELVWPPTTSFDNANMLFYRAGVRRIPPFVLAPAAANAAWMFGYAPALIECPDFNTDHITDATSMFQDARGIQEVRALDMPLCTKIGSMFNGCYSLLKVGALTLPPQASLASTFNNCYGLRECPEFDWSACTNGGSTFNYAGALQSIKGTLDWSAMTANANIFANCYALRDIRFAAGKGPKITIDFSKCQMEADTLNALFTSLPTVTGQTITISNNPGASTCDKSIATSKGWTVTG